MSDLYLGDCREVRSVLADNSIDTLITDPPYGLEFMGKGWDKGVPGVEFWKEFLAVTKPGGFLLAFGGTRTFHRMTVAIEDAGWEIRDCMMWIYGSGFPKSHDISKGIDKAKGAKRAVVGKSLNSANRRNGSGTFGQIPENEGERFVTAPSTDLAEQWNGWGTALKPAWEPIIVAMKPLDGTFAANAEKHGVAGLNIDGGRISAKDGVPKFVDFDGASKGIYGDGLNGSKRTGEIDRTTGRWPANLILDEEAGKMLDEQSGQSISRPHKNKAARASGSFNASSGEAFSPHADSGGASRFFYCAKSSKSERNAGCEGLDKKEMAGAYGEFAGDGRGRQTEHTPAANSHPTVKPLKLMEYLCTLTKTPTGGIVLDPFAGSGTTLLAAKNTGREYVGIEQNPDYYGIIKARLGLK